MRWLACFVLFLGLLAAVIAGYFLGRADASVQAEGRSPDAPLAPAALEPARSRPPKVTVDGKAVPPDEAEAIEGAFRELMGRAFAAAVNKAAKDMAQALQLNGNMEHELLENLPRFGPDAPDEGPFLVAIHLIQPGVPVNPPKMVEARFGEWGTIRLNRETAAVDRPVAVMTLTYVVDGRLIQRDKFLVWGTDGKWKPAETARAPDRDGGK